MANFLTRIFGSRNQRLLRQYSKVVNKINALEEGLQALGDLLVLGLEEAGVDHLVDVGNRNAQLVIREYPEILFLLNFFNFKIF